MLASTACLRRNQEPALRVIAALHPSGHAERVGVIGSCEFESKGECGSAPVDLLVLRPTPGEWRSSAWRALALAQVHQIDRNGIVYALCAAPWRTLVARELRSQGFVIDSYFLHLPNVESSRYLLPIDARIRRYASTRLSGRPQMSRRIAIAAAMIPGIAQVVRTIAPSVGFVARRPCSARAGYWLQPELGDPEGSCAVAISQGWRGPDSAMVVHCLQGTPAKGTVVAKIAPRESRVCDSRAERNNLRQLAPLAALAGADVPRLLRCGSLGEHEYILETAVEGEPATSYLQGRPGRFDTLFSMVSEWLRQWNRMTAGRGHGAVASAVSTIHERISELESVVPDSAAYRESLLRLSSLIPNGELPSVAAHNDLTMWNVFVNGDRIGVVDWERATQYGLPFADLFYAALDIAAGICSYRSHETAYDACFSPGGRNWQAVSQSCSQLRRKLAMSCAAVELCFHLNWLEHACNERRLGDRRSTFNSLVPKLSARRLEDLSQWA